MPWVQAHRDELRRNKHQQWRTYLDCEDCLTRPESTRATQRCGWVAHRKHERPGFIAPTAWPIAHPEICPGYVAILPQVLEAYRAIKWKDSLTTRYETDHPSYGDEPPTPTPLLMDCIDIAEATLSEVEAHAMRPKE